MISENVNNRNVIRDSNIDNDNNNKNENIFDEYIDDKLEVTSITTTNAKVVQTMKKLQAVYNDDANKIINQASQGKMP